MLAEKLAEEGHEAQGGSAGLPRLQWTQSSATASRKWVDQLRTGGEAPEMMAGRQQLSLAAGSSYYAGMTSGRADAQTPRRRRYQATAD